MKKGMHGRLLALLLALVMVLSILPMQAIALEPETSKATLVTDASTLKAGDQIILAAEANGKTFVAGAMSGKFLTSVETSIDNLAASTEVFTLGGKADKWTLTASDGKKISTQAAKALNNRGKGTDTWKITIAADKTATVASTDETCGRILYNVNTPRFMNYTSNTNKSMLLPSIYKLESAKEKVATPTAVPATGSELEVGSTVAFSCATADAKIFYKTTGEYVEYTAPVAVNAETTFTVKATKDGMSDSAEATFTYKAYKLVDKYVKAETLADGDEVVAFNKGNGMALSSTILSSYYLTPVAATVAEDTLTADSMDTIVWAVTKNENGTYTFKQGDKTLGASSGTNSSGKTVYNLNVTGTGSSTWDLTSCNEENHSYYLSANGMEGSYGKIYIEYFVYTNKKTGAKTPEFTAFDARPSKLTEAAFGFEFYKKTQDKEYVSGGETPDPEPVEGMIPDGEYVLYVPAHNMALSSNYGGYYNSGVGMTIADDAVKVEASSSEIWTVKSNADKTVTISFNGQNLGMAEEKTSTPLGGVNDKWELIDRGNGRYYIRNTGRNAYLQWYVDKTCFSAYYSIASGSEKNFEFRFVPATVKAGGETGELPKEGDKVVIYNQNAEAVLAAQNGEDSPSINKALAEIKDGKAIPENGAVVFEVKKNGNYYEFYNETYGYLCANGTGNNAFYQKEVSADADWTLRVCSGGVGGYEMESRTAKFNGQYSQWLEYYSDSFKVYSMYNVTDYTIYSFNFYPVADGVKVVKGIVNAPKVDFGSVLDAYIGVDYTLTFTVDAPFGVKGTPVVTLNGEEYAPTLKDDVYSVTFPTAKITGTELAVSVSGADNEGEQFNNTVKIPVKDEPVFGTVTPAINAQTGDEKRPEISAEVANAGEEPTVTMTVNGTEVKATYANGKVSYKPAADMANGRTTVTVTVTRKDGKSSTKTWSFTIGTAQYQRYFGQLHGHTQYSDGAGSLTDALNYIKGIPESSNVQFVAFTDHSNYFDSKNNPNDKQALYDTTLVKDSDSSHSWKTYKDTIAEFNKNNSGIVAIGGFEMTWSGGPGHINTFNTPGVVSRNNTELNNKTEDAGMKAYYALLSQQEGANTLSQFNHPGKTFGNFSDFAYWDAVIDTRMFLVEVGNGEGQIGQGGYYPSYEQYILALDQGWHVAPTNNQDNHKGRWGNANDARDVVITDNFSEEGIYEAIRARRVYATEDKNLEIDYTVNGEMMGAIISKVPEKLTFNVSVYDPDKTDSITKVELVANSGIVAYTWGNKADLDKGELTCELDPKYTYYFVRVTEGDCDLAVTAPVWVGETLKLGISKFECGTSTPVTNEKLTLTTTLFNSEAKEATVKAMTYKIGDLVIGTDSKGYTIGASSTLPVNFEWTPDKARVTTITVTAVIEQNGETYTFSKQIELDILNADDLVYIGIDASHYNEYVAGNYKDSMGNFGELAAKYSVRTVELKTSEELIAACSNEKFKALILTAPSRRLEAAQADPKTYSADELAAITKFNANGGTVVLAGWSDNYENYPAIQNNPAIKHMAATQNEVLAALGSSLRISDDATYDDARSKADGVEQWRLYFSTYNMDNFLLDRVEYDAQHPYDKLYTERFSHYGGASIYAVDANGNPTSTLPATVSPAVYGHATTYSKDVDGDGLGGAATPKYAYASGDDRLMVMASEQLAGKGLIIVSGAAFMSNFEVQYQASDNGSEKNYSNYKICENLINYLNPIKITPIADVQAEPDEGVKYTIEGIVTSNASGYDKDTAFFDCIYVQDETGGINAFPVAGVFKIGDKVRITGTTSSYQDERQIAVSSIEKIGDATPVTPKNVTAQQINDKSVLGQLVTLKGIVTRFESAEGKVQTVIVRDAEGNEARAFIDGYITTSKEVQNLVVGCEVEVTGLASWDNTFALDGQIIAPRIRIRDRDDVKCSGQAVATVVSFRPNGGEGTMPSQLYTAGDKLNKVAFTREYHTFTGWNTEADGSGKSYADEAADLPTGESIVLYAQWKESAHHASDEWKYDENTHWHECVNEGCTERTDEGKHSFKWVVDQEATATKPGVKHEECKVCGMKRSENTVIPAGTDPKTGDASGLMLWFALLIVSAGAVLAVIFARKKAKSGK